MMPANIVLGSVTGLAIVLVNFIPLQVSAMTFILNVLCLIIGFIFVGKEFGGKTGIHIYSASIFACMYLSCFSQTILL